MHAMCAQRKFGCADLLCQAIGGAGMQDCALGYVEARERPPLAAPGTPEHEPQREGALDLASSLPGSVIVHVGQPAPEARLKATSEQSSDRSTSRARLPQKHGVASHAALNLARWNVGHT
jgi:hypothetical protein